jgi:hypothetical protein
MILSVADEIRSRGHGENHATKIFSAAETTLPQGPTYLPDVTLLSLYAAFPRAAASGTGLLCCVASQSAVLPPSPAVLPVSGPPDAAFPSETHHTARPGGWKFSSPMQGTCRRRAGGPLVKGENQVDFSWANTQIDPNTIVFRVIAPVGEKMIDVKVLSVSYPPNEAALIWSVGSSDSGSVRVRVSYLLGNLNKSFNYRRSLKDETSLTAIHARRTSTSPSAAPASGPALANGSLSRSA